MHAIRRLDYAVPRSRLYEGFFGRLFRSLPPYTPPGRTEEAQQAFLRDLAAEMLESAEQANDSTLDNPRIPSGYTYFGQFVDHDITFDPASSLQRKNDPNKLNNFRTPRFDLDNLYGRGPAADPYLYDRENPGHFLIENGSGPNEHDLPRNSQHRALIGDPRNDENVLISQLQLAFLKFHNAVMTALEADCFTGDTFAEAQRIVRWHYQWVVIHDFLKRIVGVREVDGWLPTKSDPFRVRTKFFRWKHAPYMPVEFSAAAYRMGHSMVRADYELNDTLTDIRRQINKERIPIFVPPSEQPGDLDDLRGFRPLPPFWTVQWDRFFEIAGSTPQQARLLDPLLSHGLRLIPAGPGMENPLAELNLRRGVALELPSGQRVARRMGFNPLPGVTGKREDPLWHYVLREAAEGGGRRLGDVGGTIVGEVFVGLLYGDPNSYLSLDPTWTPELEAVLPIPAAVEGKFELRDILRFAGVPLDSADIKNLLTPNNIA